MECHQRKQQLASWAHSQDSEALLALLKSKGLRLWGRFVQEMRPTLKSWYSWELYLLISNIHSDPTVCTVISPHLQESHVTNTISLCLYPHNSGGAPPRQESSSQQLMVMELPSPVVLLPIFRRLWYYIFRAKVETQYKCTVPWIANWANSAHE